MKLSSYLCVRNALSLDYCIELAARSLLPVSDELLICDSDSTDGTLQLLQRLADQHPDKIRLINYPWPDPAGDGQWWVEWLNYTRGRLSHEMQLTLDADEVLDDSPDCHAAIYECVSQGGARWFDRLNYWQDGRHLIPDGHCCGKYVARLGPANLWMPSDEPVPRDKTLRDLATRDGRLLIHHLGFLRHRAAFYAKSKVVHRAFVNDYDPRLAAAEAAGQSVSDVPFDWSRHLVPYEGNQPAAVAEWIAERAAVKQEGTQEPEN